VRGKLGAAGCPVTIVVGDEDFYIPTDRIAPLREELGDERVVVVEGIGHYPMVEWADYTSFLVERAFGSGPG
jgi:pimeloyl-ACP methyl ester carboxylesterase